MTEDMLQSDTTAHGNAQWLISMTDLVSILLCFFVLMFSMSTVETEKWRKLLNVPTTSQSTAPVQPEAKPPAPQQMPRVRLEPAIDLGYLGAVLAAKLSDDVVLRDGLLAQGEEGLILALPSHLLFSPGSAEPSPRAAAALVRLGEIVRNLNNQIEVRGYTDPTPIATAQFPSNWELSLARAEAVADALTKAGYQRPIAAIGQADTRFGEIPSNFPEAVRRQLARRVDVVIGPTVAEAR